MRRTRNAESFRNPVLNYRLSNHTNVDVKSGYMYYLGCGLELRDIVFVGLMAMFVILEIQRGFTAADMIRSIRDCVIILLCNL